MWLCSLSTERGGGFPVGSTLGARRDGELSAVLKRRPALSLSTASTGGHPWLRDATFIDFKIKTHKNYTDSTDGCPICGLSCNNCYFAVLSFCNWAPGQDLWMGARTIPPHCVYWFCWLPTNNFWSAASSSRLMLCFWLMSATINGLMLPTFSEPRTNPSIWVTVGPTGRHERVCTGTHLSFDCHCSQSGSFIPCVSSASLHFFFFSLSVSQ